jgi:membrane fusion protein, multidrug efflux system
MSVMSNHSSTFRFGRPATVIVLVAATLGLAACKEEVVVEAPVRPVKVVAAAPAASERVLTFSGSVRARVEAPLSFRVPGKLESRAVEIGSRVKAGDLIATLDATDLKLTALSAQANVEAARARVEVAKDQLARVAALQAKGHVAKAAFDRAELDATQASRALEAAEAQAEQARNQTQYATLVADADGIVTRVAAEPGQVVGAGTPVAVIARDGDKEVMVAVPESEISAFAPGQSVAVRLYADRATTLPGTVRDIAGAADPASRTFQVRVAIGAAEAARLGMTASVDVAIPVANAGFEIPLTAFTQKDGSTFVFIVEPATTTVSKRAVSVDSPTSGGLRVTSGLTKGDLVVVAGVQFLTPGQPVRLDSTATTTALR